MTLQSLRMELSRDLKKTFLENPLLAVQADSVQLDVDLILAHFLHRERTWILFNRDFQVSCDDEKKIRESVEKRKTGFPVAYITGQKEFFGLSFKVSPAVLIPKPDTELLVELAWKEILEKSMDACDSRDGCNERNDSEGKKLQGWKICDMCSGSGCVGVSLGTLLEKEKISYSMSFCDISPQALTLTKENAAAHLKSVDSLKFYETNLFSAVQDSFNLIVTNPPYVPYSVSMELLKDGRSEPVLALNGDVVPDGSVSESCDGLDLIRALVPQCCAHLAEGGLLLMETGEYNAEETAELFKKAGLSDVHIERDMNGMLRDVCGRKI